MQGKLRIGFFTVRDIQEGEEVTFDYQFQRFGYAIQRNVVRREREGEGGGRRSHLTIYLIPEIWVYRWREKREGG